MANNRMYLFCNICSPLNGEPLSEPKQPARFCLGKYYPDTGYWIYEEDKAGFGERYSEWLDFHEHKGEEYAFRLGYEVSEILPQLLAKNMAWIFQDWDSDACIALGTREEAVAIFVKRDPGARNVSEHEVRENIKSLRDFIEGAIIK